MIDQKFVDEVGAALADNCPRASASPDAVARIKAKILSYDAKIGQSPSVAVVLGWGREEERNAQAAVDAEEAEARKEQDIKDARKQRFRDWNSPSGDDKAALVQELRERQRAQERPVLKPSTAYTDAEISAMSADEYKTKVLRVEPLAELNASRPTDERRKLIEQITLRKPKRDTPLKKAMRRVVREGLSK